jgi:hypothetical protein
MCRDDRKISAKPEAWRDAYQHRIEAVPYVYGAPGWVLVEECAKATQVEGKDLPVDRPVKSVEILQYPRGFHRNSSYNLTPKRFGDAQIRVL